MSNKVAPDNRRASSSLGANKDGLDTLARLKERKKMRNFQKEFAIDFILDTIDVVVKLSVIATVDDVGSNLIGLYITWAIALLLSLGATVIRVQTIMDMTNVVEKGYSKTWKKKERIVSNQGEEDPRIARDAARRQYSNIRYRSIQAFFADLPWILVNFVRLGSVSADLITLLSICLSGFGFGVKFASFVSFIKALFFSSDHNQRADVYEALAANVVCGVATSTNEDTEAAIAECYQSVFAQLGTEPTFVILVMTAPHEHEKGLKKFRTLSPNAVCCGSTTCQGVMSKNNSVRDAMVVTGMWAISDPEGNYQVGMVDYAKGEEAEGGIRAESRKTAKVVNALVTEAMIEKQEKKQPPSFVWISSSPGPEDRLLEGFGSYFTNVPIVGGSAADNDITGKWKSWCSQSGSFDISGNGCAFTICHCSAVIQTQLFTGYNATEKKGIITATAGLREILTIDGKPVNQVYNAWTGGEYDAILAEPEDSNILGPSSLYPVGQACGTNEDGQVFYRSMHPHLFKKATNSMTLFSDVAEGEEVIMMAGTKENIVNRISGVASHVVRDGGFSLNEIRGSLIIFCAGCMMFASDSMDEASRKLNKALGGTPYLGIHTFGEQGAFPDGKSRHGNLMFSALVVSSRRRNIALLNVDTGVVVKESEPEFEKIIESGGYSN